MVRVGYFFLKRFVFIRRPILLRLADFKIYVRLDDPGKPWRPWELKLELASMRRSGEVVVRLAGAVLERGRFRLGPLDLELRFRERLAIVGPNGSGKTTLVDALLGVQPLAAGSRLVGPGVELGAIDQARTRFAGRSELLSEFRTASSFTDEDARTLLAKFGLGADDVLRTGASLSPGERTRAELALVSARGVNCLVLDEPTNHLDRRRSSTSSTRSQTSTAHSSS